MIHYVFLRIYLSFWGDILPLFYRDGRDATSNGVTQLGKDMKQIQLVILVSFLTRFQ